MLDLYRRMNMVTNMYWNGTTDTTAHTVTTPFSTVRQLWWRIWMVFAEDGILKRESWRDRGLYRVYKYLCVWCTYWLSLANIFLTGWITIVRSQRLLSVIRHYPHLHRPTTLVEGMDCVCGRRDPQTGIVTGFWIVSGIWLRSFLRRFFFWRDGSLLYVPNDYDRWYVRWLEGSEGSDCGRTCCGPFPPANNDPRTNTIQRRHEASIISVRKYWHILYAYMQNKSNTK